MNEERLENLEKLTASLIEENKQIWNKLAELIKKRGSEQIINKLILEDIVSGQSVFFMDGLRKKLQALIALSPESAGVNPDFKQAINTAATDWDTWLLDAIIDKPDDTKLR